MVFSEQKGGEKNYLFFFFSREILVKPFLIAPRPALRSAPRHLWKTPAIFPSAVAWSPTAQCALADQDFSGQTLWAQPALAAHPQVFVSTLTSKRNGWEPRACSWVCFPLWLILNPRRQLENHSGHLDLQPSYGSNQNTAASGALHLGCPIKSSPCLQVSNRPCSRSSKGCWEGRRRRG